MDLPFLAVNMAMTLDGKVALPDGKWYGCSSPEDRRRMSLIRKISDALIMGVNSIENDDPSPSVNGGKGPVPVVIARNRLPSHRKKVFHDSRTILLAGEKIRKDDMKLFQNLCRVEVKNEEDLEPVNILRFLYHLGYEKILLEGGPKLNHSFFRKNLVDELNLTIVPFIFGQKSLPGIVDGNSVFPNFLNENWILELCEKSDNEVFLRYAKKKPHNNIKI